MWHNINRPKRRRQGDKWGSGRPVGMSRYEFAHDKQQVKAMLLAAKMKAIAAAKQAAVPDPWYRRY